MPVNAILQAIAIAGAIACGGAYVYGYIMKPRGNRRMHVASLLFSGIALANVPGLLQAGGSTAGTVYAVNLVFFLLLAALLQAISAFRGRSSDRREARRAEDAPAAKPVAAMRDAA